MTKKNNPPQVARSYLRATICLFTASLVRRAALLLVSAFITAACAGELADQSLALVPTVESENLALIDEESVEIECPICDLLSKHGLEISLHEARQMLESIEDPKKRASQAQALLNAAAYYGIVEIADMVVNELKYPPTPGNLSTAMYYFVPEMIVFLLQNGVKNPSPALLEAAAFYVPAWHGGAGQPESDADLKAMRILLENGADPNFRDAIGRTALHFVSGEDAGDKVKLLLEFGANPNLTDDYDQTPLELFSGRAEAVWRICESDKLEDDSYCQINSEE